MALAYPPKFTSSVYNPEQFVQTPTYERKRKNVYTSSTGVTMTINSLAELRDIYYFGAVGYGTGNGVNVAAFTVTLPLPTRTGTVVQFVTNSTTSANTYTINAVGGGAVFRAAAGTSSAAATTTLTWTGTNTRLLVALGGYWQVVNVLI